MDSKPRHGHPLMKPGPQKATRCAKDLHDMAGDNLGVNKATGRHFCRACHRQYVRDQRKRAGKCPKGLHSFGVKENIYVTATGQRRCRRCYFVAQALRKAAEAEAAREAAAAAAERARRPAVASRHITGIGNEIDARFRLALMVRATP